jgi:hypothetical protein
MNGPTSGGSSGACNAPRKIDAEEHQMQKTSTLAAYVAWILALVAILMPPALATAGTDVLTSARDALYAMLEDEPPMLTLADLRVEEPGWQA